MSFGLRLSAGSMAGAVLGVKLNLIIPEEQVKILLYVVVLLSGISILLRKAEKLLRRRKRRLPGPPGQRRRAFDWRSILSPPCFWGLLRV